MSAVIKLQIGKLHLAWLRYRVRREQERILRLIEPPASLWLRTVRSILRLPLLAWLFVRVLFIARRHSMDCAQFEASEESERLDRIHHPEKYLLKD